MELKNYFKVLNVHRKSTEQEIKAAWNELAKDNHPDKVGDTPEAQNAMSAINIAYSALTRNRKEYEKLLKPRRKCGTCEGEGVKKKQKGFKKVTYTPCAACHGSGVEGL